MVNLAVRIPLGGMYEGETWRGGAFRGGRRDGSCWPDDRFKVSMLRVDFD